MNNKMEWISDHILQIESCLDLDGAMGALAFADLADEYFFLFGTKLVNDLPEYYASTWEK